MRLASLGLAALIIACAQPQPRPTRGEEPIPLLVDVDMGLDDARVLLALTRQARYRVQAVTTVEGSAGARRGADNALRLLASAGVHDIPVAVGAERALAGPVTPPPWRELTDSLSGVVLPPPRRSVEQSPGVELLRRKLRAAPAPLPILALGPVTNLAELLRAEPVLRRRIAAVYLLGDFWSCDGYNCRTDPEAARTLREAGVPLFMILRSATDAVPFDAALLARVHALRGPLARIIEGLMARHASPSLKLWDDAVLGSLLEPGLLSYRPVAPKVYQARQLDAPRLVGLLLSLWDRPEPFHR